MDELDIVNLKKFRKMMKESGNEFLNLTEIEDDILLRFIRRPKVNLQDSFKILTNILKVRFSQPFVEIVEKVCPSAVRYVFDKQIFGVLKKRDRLGRQVIWLKLSRWNPDEVSEHDLFIAIVILGWELLGSKVTQLKGVVGILDAADCSLAQIFAIPIKLQMYLKLFLQCNPFHIGGGHILFAPKVFNIAFTASKSLLPSNHRKLLHSHRKSKHLLQYVPASILPNFLGGLLTEKDATDSKIIEILLKKDEYYKELIIEIGKTALSTSYVHVETKR